MATSLPAKTEQSIKNKALTLQREGILPEVNPWTLNEALFICDVFRIYSVEELHMMLNHPKWAIQSRIDILTATTQKLSRHPFSTPEHDFIIAKSPNLSVKEMAVFLNRSDEDIKNTLEQYVNLHKIPADTLTNKDSAYSGNPKLQAVNCSICGSIVKLRHEGRLPELIYCSMRCKFDLPLNKQTLLYVLLDERKTIKDAAKTFGVPESKINTLIKVYLPSKTKKKAEKIVPAKNPSQRSGRRDDLNGLYVRSGWEANVARVLNKKRKKWEYEPKTFVFNNIQRGSVSYTPDFLIKGSPNIWVEVKGRMNTGDYTKLLNFKRQYPKEFAKLRGIVSKNSGAAKAFKRLGIPILWYYGDLSKEYKDKIPMWEGA
jgi:endogenous inhibitor of DNA gyrase (YacG/DUF329 family)